MLRVDVAVQKESGWGFVAVNSAYTELYALKPVLTKQGLAPASLMRLVDRIRKAEELGEASTHLFFAITKHRDYADIYVFYYNPDMAEWFCRGVFSNIEKLSGSGVADAITRCFALRSWITEEGKEVPFRYPPNEDVALRWLEDWTNLLEGRDIRYYVARGIRDLKPLNLADILNLNFEGTLLFFFDFSSVHEWAKIKRRIPSVSSYAEVVSLYRKIEKVAKENPGWLTKMSVMLIIDADRVYEYGKKHDPLPADDKEQYVEKAIERVFGFLGFDYILKRAGAKHLVYSTPLLLYPSPYVFIYPTEKLTGLFSSHGEAIARTKFPHAYRGRNGDRLRVVWSPAGYDEAYRTANRHIYLTGQTGSGKSVTVQEMLRQFLGFDPLSPRRLDLKREKKRVRYFEKGYSSRRLIERLEKAGVEISRFDKNPDLMRFNLLEAGIEMRDYIVSMLNLILEARSGGRKESLIDETERDLLERHLVALFKRKHTAVVGDLNTDAYVEDYEFFIKHGYRDSDYVVYDPSKLGKVMSKEEFKTRFRKYFYPTLEKLVGEIEGAKDASGLTAIQREKYASLYTKLQSILSAEIFSLWSNIDIRGDFIYADIAKLMSHSLFVPIVFSLLQFLVTYDKENDDPLAPKIDKIYIFEEAHTYSHFEYARRVLEHLSREARKYRIILFFVSQKPEDIKVLTQDTIANRVFLLSPDPKDRATTLSFLRELYRDDEVFLLRVENAPPFSMVADNGIYRTVFRFDLSPELLKLYETQT